MNLDWGSVPAWFGSGSVTAALYVIWRDRGKDARRHASQVMVTVDVEIPGMIDDRKMFSLEDKPRRIFINVFNASDAPIAYIRVYYSPFRGVWPEVCIADDATPYDEGDFTSVDSHDYGIHPRRVGGRPLAPGRERVFEIEISARTALAQKVIDTSANLVFQDVAGAEWVRTVGGGKLRRNKPDNTSRAWNSVRGAFRSASARRRITGTPKE